MNKVSNLLFALGMIVVLGACQDTPLYEKSYAFENHTWDRSVKPKFRIEIKDTTKFYDFVLTVRTTTDFPYSNLWLFLNTQAPSGIKGREPFKIITQTENLTWNGNKTGSVVEFLLTFKSRKLPEKGAYTFVVEQGITESKLVEVLDLTFKVVEQKEASN